MKISVWILSIPRCTRNCPREKICCSFLRSIGVRQDATELCDRVAFIIGGQIYALDSPHNLIMSKGAAKVTYTWMDHGEQSKSCLLSQLSEDQMLRDLIAENKLQSIHSSEPDLNDIFMEITGRTLV